MKKLRLYIETSVWNFCFADDAPEKKDITLKFFEKVKSGDYEIFVSDVVFREISKADYEKNQLLLGIINQYNPEILVTNTEAIELSESYILDGVLQANSIDDAIHAAVATVYKMDALISWNLRHLANLRKMEQINDANRRHGYAKRLELLTPMEVSDAEI
jgi:predicted nucleic acid-binding protein